MKKRTSPAIITKRLPRLEKSTGIQITATIRPDLNPKENIPALSRKIERLILTGTSHFRLNLSHFTPEDEQAMEEIGLTRDEYEARWRRLVQCIHRVRDELGVNVFIMLDTAGPEFRIEKTSEGLKCLEPRKEYLLSAESDGLDGGDGPPTIYVSMPARFRSFGENIEQREISFKDGDCSATVVKHVRPKVIRIRPLHNLDLSAGQHVKVNFPNFDLHGITSLGRSDYAHIEFFLNIPKAVKTPSGRISSTGEIIPIDYVAQSFVRRARDIADLEAILNTMVSKLGIDGIETPLIIPKIETAQAVVPETLRRIARNNLTAAIMVARGDLGSECTRWMVAAKQRAIIRVAHAYLKPVLVATEVYGSMGKHPKEAWQPNRGEVLDLRHALEAGVDGIVFSAETGARTDPETTVEFAVKQAHEDEKDIERLDLHEAERDSRRERLQFGYARILDRPIRTPQPVEPLLFEDLADYSTMDWACAAVYRANIRGAVGIFPFTVAGNTVRDMVHFLPYRPIIALTDNKEALGKLALFAHVHPVLVETVPEDFDVEDLKELVKAVIEKFDMTKFGKEALATMPHPVRNAGGTDTLVRILLARK